MRLKPAPEVPARKIPFVASNKPADCGCETSHKGNCYLDPVITPAPVQTITRTEYDSQRVPTIDHEYDLLQRAIAAEMKANPAIEPYVTRIRNLFDQLRGGSKTAPALRTAQPLPGTTLGWTDQSP